MGSVVIQLYAGECTPCVDRASNALFCPKIGPNYRFLRKMPFSNFFVEFSDIFSNLLNFLILKWQLCYIMLLIEQ